MVIIALNTRFGKWTTKNKGIVDSKGRHRILCRCDCGEEKEVIMVHLTSRKSTSCGCGAGGRNKGKKGKIYKKQTKPVASKMYQDYLDEACNKDPEYLNFLIWQPWQL